MRAIVFEGVGQAVVAEIDEPTLGPSDVLLDVVATGVCHTDLDILHGRYLAAYPVVPGHEIAGTVIAKGPQASGVEVGARVVVDPLIVCGRCPACAAGRPSLCENLEAYGATANGGFASRVAIDARNVHPIGGLPFVVAALAEPFACVLHGVDRAGRIEGRRALVLGAGPIGLMMMMALGARGAASVVMADIEESRLEPARALGAKDALHPNALGDRDRFDLVVDCTGVPAVCERMPSLTRDGGAILFFGVCPPAARIGLAPYEVFRRELTLIGSHSLSNNIPDALRVLAGLGERATALVSHRLTLDEIVERLRAPVKQRSMKIQFAAA